MGNSLQQLAATPWSCSGASMMAGGFSSEPAGEKFPAVRPRKQNAGVGSAAMRSAPGFQGLAACRAESRKIRCNRAGTSSRPRLDVTELNSTLSNSRRHLGIDRATDFLAMLLQQILQSYSAIAALHRNQSIRARKLQWLGRTAPLKLLESLINRRKRIDDISVSRLQLLRTEAAQNVHGRLSRGVRRPAKARRRLPLMNC
jgi:hypothetical protein